MGDRRLRLRAILDRQFLVITTLLLILVLLGGWLTYTTHISPGTAVEEQPTASWETVGQFDHSATVQKNTSVFSTGETLSNRSVYFTSVSPRLDGAFRFSYDASDQGNMTPKVSLSLVMRGVESSSRGQNETILWQKRRLLTNTTTDGVNSREPVRVPFSVNMSGVSNQIELIDEQLGNPPGETEVFVRASVYLQGTVNGNSVNRGDTYTFPIVMEQNTYRPKSADPVTKRHQEVQTVTVERSYGSLRNFGSPLLLIVSCITLVGLLMARHNELLGLSSAERARLKYTDERETYDEWISTVKLPDEAYELPRAKASSLGNLVDFAIDSDNRVIEDPDEDAYYVTHDGYLYTYHPPSYQLVNDSNQNGSGKLIGIVSSDTSNSDGADDQSKSSNEATVEE